MSLPDARPRKPKLSGLRWLKSTAARQSEVVLPERQPAKLQRSSSKDALVGINASWLPKKLQRAMFDVSTLSPLSLRLAFFPMARAATIVAANHSTAARGTRDLAGHIDERVRAGFCWRAIGKLVGFIHWR